MAESDATYRMLHMADLHLGTSFAMDRMSPDVGLERRAGLLAALRRILALAREQRVQAITIAGDLYDHAYALPDLAGSLAEEFLKVAPIRVFVTPGEHDPYTPDSLYALHPWPENVTIFKPGPPSRVKLQSGLYLWGAACPPGRHGRTWNNLRVEQNGTHILLVHAADVATQPAPATIYPIDAGRIAGAGFSLALLGHEHCARSWPEASPCCHFPGGPEPLHADEAQGEHTVALVTVSGSTCRVQSIPVNQWRYLTLDAHLTGCASLREMVERVERSLDAARVRDDRRAICTVRLTGRPDAAVRLSALQQQIDSRAHLRFQTHVDGPRELESLAEERTIRGTLVRHALQRMTEARDDIVRESEKRSLSMAIEALDGKQEGFGEIR